MSGHPAVSSIAAREVPSQDIPAIIAAAIRFHNRRAAAYTNMTPSTTNPEKWPAEDEQQQRESQAVTKRLVELFGDADQTSIHMQGSTFHADSGKFSGVTNPEAREKLRSAGLLLE